MSEATGKGRRPKVGVKEDYAERKHFPNSIRFTLRRIRQKWLGNPDKELVEDFLAAFGPKWNEVNRRFGRTKELGSGRFERLECGSSAITFVDLKAVAEFLEVPTSVVSAFTYSVGDAARGDATEDIVRRLYAIEVSVGAIRKSITGKDAREVLITRMEINPKTGNKDYDPNIEILREAVGVFKEANKKTIE